LGMRAGEPAARKPWPQVGHPSILNFIRALKKVLPVRRFPSRKAIVVLDDKLPTLYYLRMYPYERVALVVCERLGVREFVGAIRSIIAPQTSNKQHDRPQSRARRLSTLSFFGWYL